MRRTDGGPGLSYLASCSPTQSQTEDEDTFMIRLLKSFLPREPLPPHVHFHIDDHGNEVWCDESVCRPSRRPEPLLFPPLR